MAKWSYNGIELLALPEWDREKYPYAVVSTFVEPENDTTGWRYAYFFSSAPYLEYGFSSKEVCSMVSYHYDENTETAWKSFYVKNDVPIDDLILSSNHPIWANFDLWNSDGSLEVAASNPIDAETGEEIDLLAPPVQKYDGLERVALIAGYRVGQLIRGMR